MNEQEETKTCDHVFIKKTERVRPSRKNEKQPQFTHSGAYFVYNVCEKCDKKIPLDYVVEQ